MPGTVIGVHDVVEAAARLVPEARVEARDARASSVPRSAAVNALGDPERVEPERLDLDRLADARRHDPVADLGVHPGELHARLAGGEQAVVVERGCRSACRARSPSRIACDRRRASALRSRGGALPARGLDGARGIVHGDDVPERRVDRVELGRVALVGEAVGQHPLGDRPGPLEQDRPRFVEPAGREAEPAQRDERVAAPVGEPRIAGDDGLARAAPHDVRVGGALSGESRTARRRALLRRGAARAKVSARRRPGGSASGGAEHEHGVARREIASVKTPGAARSSS